MSTDIKILLVFLLVPVIVFLVNIGTVLHSNKSPDSFSSPVPIVGGLWAMISCFVWLHEYSMFVRLFWSAVALFSDFMFVGMAFDAIKIKLTGRGIYKYRGLK